MILLRNYHFLSFEYQPQISPVFTICKVQIMGYFDLSLSLFQHEESYKRENESVITINIPTTKNSSVI